MYFIMAIVFVSCGSSDSDPSPTLEVSPSTITASAERGNNPITITSNSNWQIVNIPSWIEVFPSAGKGDGSVQVTVLENTGIEERSGSFNVVTNDDKVSRVVSVQQKGKDAQLTVDVTSIILPSAANSSQVINITCNSTWSISGLPDWLQISSLSGNGNSSVIITTRDINESSIARTATIVVSSNDKIQAISVQQEPALSSCRVVPSNITSLYYAVIFNLEYSSEVALTKMALVSDYEFKHMTEKEVIATVESMDSQIPEDETIYTRSVDEDTKYHILSLSYDKKGNRGELVDVEFSSPEYLSGTDDAWCSIDDAGVTSSLFIFSVYKKGRCATYDLIYGANVLPNYLTGALMAFEINYYNKNGKKNWLSEACGLKIESNYPNDHTFSCAFNPYSLLSGVIATTWGIFSDGTRSSDITTVSGDTSESEIRSLNGSRKNSSEIEWIRNQKGWIKTTLRDIKN